MAHLTPPTLLETSASSLTNILPSQTKLHLSPRPVTITCVNYAVSGLTSIHQLSVPLLPLSSTPNLITVILSTINSLSINCSVSSRSRTLTRTVVKASKSCHITPILRSLHWLRMSLLSLCFTLCLESTPFISLRQIYSGTSKLYLIVIRCRNVCFFVIIDIVVLTFNLWSLIS